MLLIKVVKRLRAPSLIGLGVVSVISSSSLMMENPGLPQGLFFALTLVMVIVLAVGECAGRDCHRSSVEDPDLSAPGEAVS